MKYCVTIYSMYVSMCMLFMHICTCVNPHACTLDFFLHMYISQLISYWMYLWLRNRFDLIIENMMRTNICIVCLKRGVIETGQDRKNTNILSYSICFSLIYLMSFSFKKKRKKKELSIRALFDWSVSSLSIWVNLFPWMKQCPKCQPYIDKWVLSWAVPGSLNLLFFSFICRFWSQTIEKWVDISSGREGGMEEGRGSSLLL